jgi:NAD(P)-dependent dehydrogenase (short-subunit alcohol dehydrogenase family)
MSRSRWDWPTEIAVVTGASSGIGKDIAQKLANLGVQVAILDIQQPPKDVESHQNISFYHCDVTSTESIAAAAERIQNELGHPTILINNAGITLPTPILKLPESFLRKIVGVNLMSLWFTTQAFLPHMIQMNKGHIITIASMASFIALPRGADYSATKAGALAFHESLACEIKHFYKSPNILTTVVHPNFVSTPLITDLEQELKSAGMPILSSQYVAEQVVSQVKCGRGGQLIIGAPSLITGIRGWPTWLQESLRDVLGRLEAKSGLEH